MFYPKEEYAGDHRRVVDLVRCYGGQTLAFFGLARENLQFLAPGGEGLVSYRLANNVAVVLGDPICAPQAFERVTRSFLEFCALHQWQAAFYQTDPRHLSDYRRLRLHAFKMGEEAILHPQTFTLSGSAMANVRTTCRRAEREGVSIQQYEGVLPTEVIAQLEYVSSRWLEQKMGRHGSEMGFTMGRIDEVNDWAEQAESVASLSLPGQASHKAAPRLMTFVVLDRAGEACAFVTFTPIYGCLSSEATPGQDGMRGWGWGLDMMRRIAGAPPGVMELLLVHAIRYFQERRAEVASLGLVAWADTRQEMTSTQRQLTSFVTERLRLLEPRYSLFNFKQKFQPCWESRYIVASKTLALPKIALAVLRARNSGGGGQVRLLK